MKNTICEKLMWAAMNGTIMKFLATELPECDLRSLKTKFKNQYRKIRSEVDDIGPITKNPLRICLTGGVIWLAAYEACEGKMDEEMFSRMITDTMKSPLFKKAFGAKDPFVAEKQQRKVVSFQTANGISDSEYNWYTDYTPGRDETEYFCTYRKCGLCALGRKYGHPELIPYMCQIRNFAKVFCNADLCMEIMHRHARFVRHSDLVDGPCCHDEIIKIE